MIDTFAGGTPTQHRPSRLIQCPHRCAFCPIPPQADSRIVSPELEGQLCDWIGDHAVPWRLFFRATRDGYTAAKFHELCDGKGPTVTVLRVNDVRKDRDIEWCDDSSDDDLERSDHIADDVILGVFTSVAWSSDSRWHTDTAMFIFSNNGHPERFRRYPSTSTRTSRRRRVRHYINPVFDYAGAALHVLRADGAEKGRANQLEYDSDSDSDGEWEEDPLKALLGPHGGLRWLFGVSVYFRADEIEVFVV